MKNKHFISSLLLLVFLFCTVSVSAQKKRNSRPTDEPKKEQPKKAKTPVYFYEFAKDEFLIKKILIEHDENGIGKITFLKKDFAEDISEPLKLSSATLDKLKSNWDELKFLESNEEYQSKERDYGHLGTIHLKMDKNSKKRTVEFNWTENLNVKALADEYRKIGNQFIWMFDINAARQNQPLESPRIIRALDSHLRRNAIADPVQMIPFLKELSEDERMPLISRNHAERLMKKIEKDKDKQKEKEPEVKEKGQ